MQKSDRRGSSKGVAGFGERMSTSAAARKLIVEKYQANKVDVNDPAFLERQANRLAAAEARAERDGQRKAAKEAEKAQVIADRKAQQELAEAEAAAALAAQQTAEAEAAAALILLRDQGKAARDARYAARKARQ